MNDLNFIKVAVYAEYMELVVQAEYTVKIFWSFENDHYIFFENRFLFICKNWNFVSFCYHINLKRLHYFIFDLANLSLLSFGLIDEIFQNDVNFY